MDRRHQRQPVSVTRLLRRRKLCSNLDAQCCSDSDVSHTSAPVIYRLGYNDVTDTNSRHYREIRAASSCNDLMTVSLQRLREPVVTSRSLTDLPSIQRRKQIRTVQHVIDASSSRHDTENILPMTHQASFSAQKRHSSYEDLISDIHKSLENPGRRKPQTLPRGSVEYETLKGEYYPLTMTSPKPSRRRRQPLVLMTQSRLRYFVVAALNRAKKNNVDVSDIKAAWKL